MRLTETCLNTVRKKLDDMHGNNERARGERLISRDGLRDRVRERERERDRDREIDIERERVREREWVRVRASSFSKLGTINSSRSNLEGEPIEQKNLSPKKTELVQTVIKLIMFSIGGFVPAIFSGSSRSPETSEILKSDV